jgi:excinuclease ABC subunit C
VQKHLADKLQQLPKTPGVYFHKNAAGEVIYVGKAAVLKKPRAAVLSGLA